MELDLVGDSGHDREGRLERLLDRVKELLQVGSDDLEPQLLCHGHEMVAERADEQLDII